MDFIFDPGLVLYLPLSKLDGISFSSRDAYGHVCTVSGALWRPDGYYFDNTDDVIDCGSNTALAALDHITVLAWVYPTSLAASHKGIAGKNTGDTNGYWEFRLNIGTGTLNFAFWNGSAYPEITGSTGVSLNAWAFVGVTYDGARMALYLNGDVEKTQAETSGLTHGQVLLIGNQAGSGRPFGGRIGIIWVFNRALSPVEIQQNYLATKWRYR